MEKQSVSFRIKEIKTLKFVQEYIETPYPENQIFTFETGLNININKDQKLFLFDIGVLIFSDQMKQKKCAELVVRFIYEIENFNEILVRNNDEFAIPDPVILTFISISVSTVRGILFAKTEGTYLKNAILPVLDPKIFLQKK